jgi:hypothetical protein
MNVKAVGDKRFMGEALPADAAIRNAIRDRGRARDPFRIIWGA